VFIKLITSSRGLKLILNEHSQKKITASIKTVTLRIDSSCMFEYKPLVLQMLLNLHCLHLLLSYWRLQMLLPPHCLYLLLSHWCLQMLLPSQFFTAALPLVLTDDTALHLCHETLGGIGIMVSRALADFYYKGKPFCGAHEHKGYLSQRINQFCFPLEICVHTLPILDDNPPQHITAALPSFHYTC